MKIFYWAPYMGNVGTIRAVINSAKAMKKYGNHDVYLLKAYREWEGYEDEIKINGIKIIDFKLVKKIFRKLPKYNLGFRISMIIISLFSIPKLIRLFNKEKPDVVILNLLTVPALVALKFVKHKPFVIVSMQGYPRLNWWRTFLWKKLYDQVNLVWVLSERTGRLIKERIGVLREKIKLIPNPVIDNDIEEKSKKPVDHPWFVEKDKPIVIGVGRLTKQKDFPTLIKAFALVKKQVDARLVILGEGEHRPKLEQLIKELGLENDVWMPGFVKNPYKYMIKADVFVLSSLWEDPGHVLMESGFLRLPIISTQCPSGPGEFLEYGKAGFLCNVKDINCLANKIIYVLKNKNSQEVLEKVKRAYKNSLKYSLETHYKTLIEVIR